MTEKEFLDLIKENTDKFGPFDIVGNQSWYPISVNEITLSHRFRWKESENCVEIENFNIPSNFRNSEFRNLF